MNTAHQHPDFADIAYCYDGEIPAAIEQLIASEDFMKVVCKLFSPLGKDEIVGLLRSVRTAFDFRKRVVLPCFLQLLKGSEAEITFSGQEYLQEPGLVISNHRDIVMDPSLINYAMMLNDHETTAIAIGDNLLALPWVRTLVRVCGAFVVKRQEKTASAYAQLSSYISHIITEEHRSVWIAQREGRAKDSNDQTQESILKMFTFSGEGSFVQKLQRLNLIPTTISYEYDPCDYLKAQELVRRRINPDYKKAPGEDVNSMYTGIVGKKGRVHVNYARPVNELLSEIEQSITRRNEQVESVKQLIDREIFLGYRFFPINYVAYDLRFGTETFADRYSKTEKEEAISYLESRMALSNLEPEHREELRQNLLAIYSNTLVNYLKTTNKNNINLKTTTLC